jgi:Protein of unknown function (DUF2889)
MTIVPNSTRDVTVAAAARHSHGSAMGGVPPQAGFHETWSHRKNPSHPAASASRAISMMVRGSDHSAKGGSDTAERTFVTLRVDRGRSLGSGASAARRQPGRAVMSVTPVYPPRRRLDPRHGTHDPVQSTPDRRPGSIRRTTTIDMVRPDGIRRELRLVGRGRDVVTDHAGVASVVDEAQMDVVIDFLDAVSVRSLVTSPELAGLDAVVGRAAATGFRAAVDDAIGPDWLGRPIYQLLDDIPVATLVSGYAIGFAGDLEELQVDEERPWRRAEGMAELQVADLCAGFQTGGTIMQARAEGNRGGGAHVTGPVAPSIERPDDPWAHHELAALPTDGMRRRRRIDVTPSREHEGAVDVDALFRDTHMGDDGYETIIHEYVVEATVDLDRGEFAAIRAVPHVLPWYECPQAAASAERLVGASLSGLRPKVRAEFLGPTTCTHLNDTLRALEDVPALVSRLGRATRPG